MINLYKVQNDPLILQLPESSTILEASPTFVTTPGIDIDIASATTLGKPSALDDKQ